MLHYFILGLIEGLTEFLPISSTGHLIIYNYFAGLDLTSDFLKTFEISIQLGAILAVIIYYFKDLIQIKNIKLLLISVIPTLILGFVLKDFVDKFLEMPMLVAIDLIVGGLIILLAERIYSRSSMYKLSEVNYKEGLIMGAVQSIAMLPGVSRSGAIIVYGLFRNFEREVVAKFTFLLAVPTMCAATIYSVYKNREIFIANGNSANLLNLSVGFITAFVVALLVVRYALPFVRKYSFTPFAWYRIVLGLILIATILFVK